MTGGDQPVLQLGAKFSLRYMDPGDVKNDSPKLRRRLAAYCTGTLVSEYDSHGPDLHRVVSRRINEELGIAPHWRALPDFHVLFSDLPLHEMLDLVGVISACSYEFMNKLPLEAAQPFQYPPRFRRWCTFVERCFREENMSYTLDPAGSVRFLVDQAFQESLIYTIQVLGSERFSAVRACVDSAREALNGHEPKTRLATTKVFEGLETLVKITFPSARISRLNDDAVRGFLAPKLRELYGGQSTEAATAINKQCDMLNQWIGGVQAYRHGSKDTEYREIPVPAAVVFVDTGLSFIRLVAGVPQPAVQ